MLQRRALTSKNEVEGKKRIEEELFEKERCLKEALRTRDEFLSIASHELRTPLTSLRLQVQIQKKKLEQGDPSLFDRKSISRLIECLDRQSARLSDLVEEMLEISRISEGKLTLDRVRTDLVLLVGEVLDRMSDSIQLSGSKLIKQFDTSIVGYWDPFRIEQVIINLLINALKYGRGNPIELTVTQANRTAQITISDHGIGIAQENRERIFNQFERAVPASSISGLGLGLYICRQIIESHHGKISVESELGQGSTFRVELPLQ